MGCEDHRSCPAAGLLYGSAADSVLQIWRIYRQTGGSFLFRQGTECGNGDQQIGGAGGKHAAPGGDSPGGAAETADSGGQRLHDADGRRSWTCGSGIVLCVHRQFAEERILLECDCGFCRNRLHHQCPGDAGFDRETAAPLYFGLFCGKRLGDQSEDASFPEDGTPVHLSSEAAVQYFSEGGHDRTVFAGFCPENAV